jgi:SAM-dependent methyltransferase
MRLVRGPDKGYCMKTEDKIRNFWEQMGLAKPAGELVTHRDVDQVALEIDIILSLLEEDDVLLDAGCGNGFSTSIYAKKCKKVLGIDYADSMIESAKKHYQGKNLQFERQNILTLGEQYRDFSVIVSTRSLINLNSWEEQKEAIRGMHRCLERNGRLILAEGIFQGRRALNELRLAAGLAEMPPVWHNVDFDEEKLMSFLKELFMVEKDIRFGLYDILTRVYYPMVISPQEPQYGEIFQQAAFKLFKALGNEAFAKYSRESILVLKKIDKK